MKKSLKTFIDTADITTTRAKKIRQLLSTVDQGYSWHKGAPRNYALRYEMFDKMGPLVAQLTSLGVLASFVASVFFFGVDIDDQKMKEIMGGIAYREARDMTGEDSLLDKQ